MFVIKELYLQVNKATKNKNLSMILTLLSTDFSITQIAD